MNEHRPDGLERDRREQAEALNGAQAFNSNPFLWPLIAAASVSDVTGHFLSELAQQLGRIGAEDAKPLAPPWTTAHRIVLELETMQLRDFSTDSEGTATVICAPFALHGATIADFAPGHSLVEALRG